MKTFSYKTCILECQRPNLLCQCGNFLYKLIFLLKFKVFLFGYCRSTYFTLCLLHIVLAFQELDKQAIISSVGCTKDSRLKYSRIWSNYLPPFTKVALNGPRLWVIWWTTRTRYVCITLGRHSNIRGCLRTVRNWGLSVVFWSTNIPTMFGCSVIYLNLKSVIVWLF
jgi:hypothetical protein